MPRENKLISRAEQSRAEQSRAEQSRAERMIRCVEECIEAGYIKLAEDCSVEEFATRILEDTDYVLHPEFYDGEIELGSEDVEEWVEIVIEAANEKIEF